MEDTGMDLLRRYMGAMREFSNETLREIRAPSTRPYPLAARALPGPLVDDGGGRQAGVRRRRHKGATIVQEARLCFALYLQNSRFLKWSRGDSNP